MSRPVASTAEVPGTAADGVQRIQAVDRAIVLLKAVAASITPPTVLELARRCGINRATAWQLLRTLEHHGLVDRDVVTQRYTVGYGATEFALCDREYEEFSSGASAAVLNSRRSPIAVVNVWGPAPRNSARRLREIGREAVQTADEIRDLLD